jgi:predicted nucleic acid-binding protein
MIAVDSSVWIDFLKARSTPEVGVLKQFLRRQPDQVAMVDIVFAEVIQGVPEERMRRVDALFSGLPVLRSEWKHDYQAAAGIYRMARRAGFTPRGTIDCLIAAVCVRADVPLLHSDADFDRIATITALSVIG